MFAHVLGNDLLLGKISCSDETTDLNLGCAAMQSNSVKISSQKAFEMRSNSVKISSQKTFEKLKISFFIIQLFTMVCDNYVIQYKIILKVHWLLLTNDCPCLPMGMAAWEQHLALMKPQI